MPTHKLIIDADPGIGDAVAIALALCDPTLEVLGLTACGGMVSGEQAYYNLQTISSLIDPQRWPRIGWSDSHATFFGGDSGTLYGQGNDGIGDCEQISATLHQPIPSAKLLTELVRISPGELTLLTFGPLTNVCNAAERDVDFLPNLKQFVICGGSLSASGDVTPVAEFNIYSAPEAARDVLNSVASKTLLPMDLSHQFGLSFDDYHRLQPDGHSRLGRFLNTTIPFALRQSRTQLGKEGVQLPEVMAVAAVSHPELFERSSMPVDVELSGELTRGMTVFDRRGRTISKDNVEVFTDVDLQGVKDYMLRICRQSWIGDD